MKSVEAQYRERLEKYRGLVAEQTKAINRISNLRLAVFLLGAGVGSYLLVRKSYGLFAFDLIVFLTLFIFLIRRHDHLFTRRKYAETLLQINDDALKRLSGEWTAFPDDGREFLNDSHPYAQDLDIFGQGSLFQFINSAATYLGRLKLRDLLAEHPKSREEIMARQEAVGDLALKLDWRQGYLAEGVLAAKMHDPEALFTWAGRVEQIYRKPAVIFGLSLLPVITIALGIVTVVVPEMNYYGFAAAVLVQFLLLRIYAGKRGKILGMAATYAENIAAYDKMLALLEKEEFSSPYLAGLMKKLKNSQGRTAGEQIHQLVKIVDAIANRRNQFYFLFNLLFLLDYQLMFALEKWKEKSGRQLRDWLKIIGEVEALSSLALLKHDHPEWTMPVLSAGQPQFAAEEMAHPLILAGVANNLKYKQPEKILLITGSNMSGKSTLLRTAGINLVLAYAGTVVCARTFSCSLLAIYTCMRVSDNLEKNISSFYAELLRIKMLVRAMEEGQEIFFLLDEIFKGTNSIDRHTGAKALIRKLSQEKLLGLISTHDLELGDLAKECTQVRNYHFQEFYVNDEIRFDYKLRPGVSTTRNAAFLMKLAGISLDEKVFDS